MIEKITAIASLLVRTETKGWTIMKGDNDGYLRREQSNAISRWENEGGAPNREAHENPSDRHLYTRRALAVYRASSGIAGRGRRGFKKASALIAFLTPNLHNIAGHKRRSLNRYSPHVPSANEP